MGKSDTAVAVFADHQAAEAAVKVANPHPPDEERIQRVKALHDKYLQKRKESL